jgi:long-chain acyl-CoA synthetase
MNYIAMKRLFDIPYHQLKNYPKSDMFSTKTNGIWTPISTTDFLNLVSKTAKGLIALDIHPGDKIGIISTNRFEWNALDIAALEIGAIVVPIYPNISSEDYIYIFNDSKIKLCVVGDSALYSKINNLKSQLPNLMSLFCFSKEDAVPHWTEIHNNESSVSDEVVLSRKEKIQNSDLATIIYTSGTTGNPKGVMLSHNNILSNVVACIDRMPCDENSRVLTFLPVCHVYERMLHYLYMYMGCSIFFAESMDTIGENIKEVKPHMFTAVPRLIEKVYEKIISKGEELTGLKRKLFFWAVKLGEQYDVINRSFWFNFKLAIARKLIFSKWQEALGGNTRAIVSGSAALQPKLAKMFLAADITILEGYGLTETSPVISVNCIKNGIRIGTVGTLIHDVKVKIAEDGEILVKGPNVMMGYYNLPEKTAEDIDSEGWFHTGDIGTFIEGKFLKITDRKKEIFKTSGGKYIIPQAMENKFKESRFIEQIMVLGEGEKFPGALIVPNFNYIREWSFNKKLNIEDKSNTGLINNKEIQNRIQLEVDSYNQHYGGYEQIKKYTLLDHEFSVEEGELTPTLKLKRKIILTKYSKEVKQIYTL